MIKKTMIATGVALAITTTLTANIAVAEEAASWTDGFEVSGEIKNETAVFTKVGGVIGDFGTSTVNGSGATANYTGVTTTVRPNHAKRDVMKSESSVRLFINGLVGEDSEVHAELRPVRDSKAVDSHKGHESYTQQDFLRELYVDTTAGEEGAVSLRLGKQQVVWGTADGMKLLDIINPTDYREMAQNSMDESRIPVWMINAETDLEDGTNVQVVVSQPKENVFAGLNRGVNTAVRSNNQFLDDATLNNGTDTGHAFMMKGVDSITGEYNGFLNIAPDLGSVATRFAMAFTPTATTGGGAAAPGTYNPMLATMTNLNAPSMQGFTVNGFESMTMAQMSGALVAAGPDNTLGNIPGGFYKAVTDTWNGLVAQMGSAANVQAVLGLASANSYELTGAHMLAYGFQPLYNSNLANTTATNDTAFDYMGNTTFRTFDRFVNARSQYVYNMPSDSDADIALRVKRSLDSGLNYSLNYSYNYDKNPIINLSWRNDAGETLSQGTDMFCPAAVCGADTTTLGDLTDSNSNIYGGQTGNSAILTFEQEVKRAHNVGSALDYAIDTESLGAIVLRGEFLYQKDVYQPIVDLDRMSIGDLVGALKMEKANHFKYVLGADVTVATNMMISAQFIQDRNVDYVDAGNRYTADYATMHLTNGFNKAEKNKEFYSLFFSKPFGGEQQHRWNNILMLEENGGRWNRFDVEYSFNDEFIGTAEMNKYWGDANTQFGQLEKSSNFQLGLKYIF